MQAFWKNNDDLFEKFELSRDAINRVSTEASAIGYLVFSAFVFTADILCLPFKNCMLSLIQLHLAEVEGRNPTLVFLPCFVWRMLE